MFDSTKWHNEYRKEKLKRISLDVQKDFYDQIKKHTETTNESVNGFIKRAITETILNDNNNMPSDTF